MSARPSRSLKADWAAEWFDVWRREDPSNYVYDVYFDVVTGELTWVDNPTATLTPIDTDAFDSKMDVVTSDPDRYEKIMPLTHEEHSDILRQWFEEWPEHVRNACDTGSLYKFLDSLAQLFPDHANHARSSWNAYQEACLKDRAERWLYERGFAVEWTDS